MIGRRGRLRRRLARPTGAGGRSLFGRLGRSAVAAGLRRRLVAAGVDLGLRASAGRASARLAAAGAVGALWLGPIGAGLAVAGVGVSAILRVRRRGRRRSERMEAMLPDALEAVAAGVRAGLSLPQALRAAEPAPPVDAALEAALLRLDVGEPLEAALDAFVAAAGIPSAGLVATALRIGHRAGGDLPGVLGTLAVSLRERERASREVRAATAQARLSAWVIAGMPIAFLLLTGATSRDQTRLLLYSPTGWMLLAVGLGLEAGGMLWMRRVVAPR